MSDVLRLPLPALVSECDLPEPGLINIVSLAKELQVPPISLLPGAEITDVWHHIRLSCVFWRSKLTSL